MSEFEGMSDKESCAHQLKRWVAGESLHNTVRNECCPDFSCCQPDNLMPIKIRSVFAASVAIDDFAMMNSILSLALNCLTHDLNLPADSCTLKNIDTFEKGYKVQGARCNTFKQL